MPDNASTQPTSTHKPFDQYLKDESLFPLKAEKIEVMQINVGKLCNQVCTHCHVEAGPDRTELMTEETFHTCLDILVRDRISCVDLTGGAPEMNKNFSWFVEKCRAEGIRVKVRSNLTILLEKGYEDFPEFFAKNKLEVIASLPCYTKENVDKQRGKGVFEKSIKALHKLNSLGYGHPGTDLILDLVYNPGGALLPGNQKELEADYKRELEKNFGIQFSSLLTITNMPMGRFARTLIRSGQYEDYMKLLIDSFNPEAAQKVMCRSMISIGWDGSLYDCDFNQMIDMRCDHGAPKHIKDYDPGVISGRRIVTDSHCYGCTAGAGSSCSGALE